MGEDKLPSSIRELEHALSFEKLGKKDSFYLAGIAKSFEICFEYSWKYFKKRGLDEGFEVWSPREAIKVAGRMELIQDVELWLGFLSDRNLAVHDYLSITDKAYMDTIRQFLIEVKKIRTI